MSKNIINADFVQNEAKIDKNKFVPNFNTLSTVANADDVKISKHSIQKWLLQHIHLLFDRANEEHHINIRLLKEKEKPINRFYLLSDIFSNNAETIKKITNLVYNKNLDGYKVCLLPCTLNSKNNATTDKISGSGVIVLDIDSGNIEYKLEKLINHFGVPTFTIKSGGITEEGCSKVHVYYRLSEFQTGDNLERLIKLRGDIASAIGADISFYNSTQIIALLGTINVKYDNKPIVEIDSFDISNIYNFEDFIKNSQDFFIDNPIKELEKKAEDYALGYAQSAPVENLTEGQAYDYLTSLGQEVFKSYNNCSSSPRWLECIFAIHHQFQGNQKGYDLALRWSLTDKTGRSEENIIAGVKKAYYASKTEYTNKKVITFRSIISFVEDKQFIDNEIIKNPQFGKSIIIFNDNPLYDENYVLTENFLCIKVKPKGKNAPPPYLLPICNHLEVLGGGNGSKGTSYRLIRYIDTNGKLVENLLAISLKGQELQTYLSEINLQFNTKYYSLIHNYMLNSQASSNKINIIHKTGWNEEKTAYSLIYKNEIKSYFVDKQASNDKAYLEFGASSDEYLRKKGSLDNWKELVRLSKGNDSMILALGLPFASMWLTPLNQDGRIIHFFGESQKGKSSLLSLASSVFGVTVGSEDYSHWLGSVNSIENTCKARNDSLLLLDELHKLRNKQELPDLPYKITGGIGVVRMAYNQTTNNNRAITTWKVLTLSSGEKSYYDELSAYNLERHYKGGMMNRWADYPVVTEEFGVFSTLHEFADKFKDSKVAAENFRSHVVSLCRKNKGQAICSYLEYVFEIKDFDDVFIEIKNQFEKWLEKYFYSNPKINDRNSSQEISVAKMFALSAAALKIAADANIVDYSQDYIFEVLGRCYNKFLANKIDVHMSAEDRLMKKTLIDFLNKELHRGFYDNTETHSNYNGQLYYGIKQQRKKNQNNIEEDNLEGSYDYYIEVSKLELIFKGSNQTLVKRFLRDNEYIEEFPTREKKGETSYTWPIRHKGVGGRKINFNKLNLVKIGIVLADDQDPNDPKVGGDKYKSETEPLSIDEHISTTDIEPSKDNIVTANTAINYELKDKAHLIEFLQKAEKSITYGLDIETTGLKASDHKIALIQIYNPNLDKVFIYKVFDYPLTKEEKKLLSEINFVAHNASFERSFMPYLKNLNCSMIAYHAATSNRRCSIGDLSSYTGITYNNKKLMQVSNWVGELTEEQLEYAAKDAKATYILWQKYKDANKPVYDRMYTASFIIDDYAKRGLPVDTEALRNLRIEKENKRDELLKKLTDLGFEDIITPNNNIRTKKEVMDKVTPDVMKIVEEVRKTNSLINNIIKGVEENIVDGRLPINVLICGTETGRLATVNPNVQNFPRSGFRHIFKAREGFRFVRADFSGQELRMVAAMSNEKVLIEAFNSGKDPHAIMAARLNNMPLKTFLEQPIYWQKSERQKAKAANFGFLYGMGASRFIVNAKEAYNVDLTLAEANNIRTKFWATYSFLKKWSEKEREECKARGYALTRGGRKRRFEDIEKAYCETINTAVQGSCGEVLLETLIALPDYLKGYLVNTVHDELIFEVPIELIEDDTKYTELKNHIIGAMIAGVSKVEKRYPTLNITEIKDTERL
ncbi:PolA-like exonuclease/polymerase domain protein (plasmid) [Candidatus Megaera polyxenophila]|nr:PolA-like exonuclease/polymerase domain protein [Candidatus Megaera polyxenophila]